MVAAFRRAGTVTYHGATHGAVRAEVRADETAEVPPS
jgi:hypothetical protein